MRCVDVAALFAAAILRRNPDSVVIPFDTQAYHAQVDPGDTILSLAELSVSAVYTASPLSGDGISIDVEYIPSRRLTLGGPD